MSVIFPSNLSLDVAAFLLLSVLYVSKSPLVNSIVVKVATVALFLHVIAQSVAEAPALDTVPEGTPEHENENELHANQYQYQYPDKDPDQWLGSTDEGRPVQVQAVPPSASHNFWGSIVGASMASYRAPEPTRSFSSHLHNPNHEYEW
jgi:hypothetical protein